ncbi:MAG: HDOD domain-containing protein [Myxococcaceae bacterium]
MDLLEEALVARVKQGKLPLPPFPPVAAKLARVLSRADFELDQVVALMKSDAALAGAVLKVANSVAYSRGQEIATLPGAVMRIGARELSRHVLASGLQQAFGSPGPLSGLRRRVWRESLASAFVCQTLAKAGGHGSGELEFTAGLLHDVGKVVALSLLEELFKGKQAGPREESEWWALVERFHLELGMVLAAQWQLPKEIEAVVLGHHEGPTGELLMRQVRVADEVVALLESKPCVTEADLKELGRLTSAECAALAQALPQLPALIEAFAPTPAPETKWASVVVRLSRIARLAGPGREVAIVGAAHGPVKAELFEVGPLEFRVRAAVEAKANLLVQVKVSPELSMSANVVASEREGNRHEWTLRPYALSESTSRQWERFHLDVTKEAAAPVYEEKQLFLRRVLV